MGKEKEKKRERDGKVRGEFLRGITGCLWTF